MSKRIAVVVSQSPSKNPVKRKLEEEIVLGLMLEPGLDVTVVPNLYDLAPDSTGLVALKGIAGDLIVCAWLFERATHWILDRHSIHGQIGKTLLRSEDGNEDGDVEDEPRGGGPIDAGKSPVALDRATPDRRIYALDLRVSNQPDDFIEEIKRIRDEAAMQLVTLADVVSPSTGRPQDPIGNGALNGTTMDADVSANSGQPPVRRIDDPVGRRWYPVIDYSRCTNCMECIDFCLFGVYGVDRIDTILVEQPDNCRKGCPACSRVCPENAIIFPQHKTPAIAGAHDEMASLKIDLSQLFGAPDEGKSAIELAAMERDEQLVQAGRQAVGMEWGIPKRRAGQADAPRDELDDLVDELNDLDL